MFKLKNIYFLMVALSAAVSFAGDHNKLARFVCARQFDAANYQVKKTETNEEFCSQRFLVSPTKSFKPFVSVAEDYNCRVVVHKPTRQVKVVSQFPDNSKNYDLLADVAVSAPLSSGGVSIEVIDHGLNQYSFVENRLKEF